MPWELLLLVKPCDRYRYRRRAGYRFDLSSRLLVDGRRHPSRPREAPCPPRKTPPQFAGKAKLFPYTLTQPDYGGHLGFTRSLMPGTLLTRGGGEMMLMIRVEGSR
jgi:hypothetical protein